MRKHKWFSSSCCSAVFILSQLFPSSHTSFDLQRLMPRPSQTLTIEKEAVEKLKRPFNYRLLEQRLFQARQIYSSV